MLTTLVVVLLAALFAVSVRVHILGGAVKAAKERKFGLVEAQAAARYLNSPEQARTVLAVLVGALGYSSYVAVESAARVAEIGEHQANVRKGIRDLENQIAILRRNILSNEDEFNVSEKDKDDVRRVAAMFAAAASR